MNQDILPIKNVFDKPLITIEKEGENLFKGQTTAKNFAGWMQGKINSFARKGNMEKEFMLREILNAYRKFHPEIIGTINTKGWKGESSINIIKQLDKLIIVKFQRPDKDSEVEEVRVEVSKDELEAIILAIKRLDKGEPIPTKDLAMEYSRLAGLNHSGWKTGNTPFFSDRSNHNKYTLILQALQEAEVIEYKRGMTKVLKKDVTFEEIMSQ